jgi:hypothetical protein
LINDASNHLGKASGEREEQYITRTNKYVHFILINIASFIHTKQAAPREVQYVTRTNK